MKDKIISIQELNEWAKELCGTISDEAAKGIGYTQIDNKFVTLVEKCKQFKME